MKLGWAYLGIAAILVPLGVTLAFDWGGYIGDLVLLLSIVFIYLGSNALADADENASVTDQAK